jgi:hypothetical protein
MSPVKLFLLRCSRIIVLRVPASHLYSLGPIHGLLRSCKQSQFSDATTVPVGCDQTIDLRKAGAPVSASDRITVSVSARVAEGVSNLLKREETQVRSVHVSFTLSR